MGRKKRRKPSARIIQKKIPKKEDRRRSCRELKSGKIPAKTQRQISKYPNSGGGGPTGGKNLHWRITDVGYLFEMIIDWKRDKDRSRDVEKDTNKKGPPSTRKRTRRQSTPCTGGQDNHPKEARELDRQERKTGPDTSLAQFPRLNRKKQQNGSRQARHHREGKKSLTYHQATIFDEEEDAETHNLL